MKKKYLLYCLIVIGAILILNAILPMKFYSTDGYYFWGLAKYIEAGKLLNSNAFGILYPAGFSFILNLIRTLFPWLTYNEFSIAMLIFGNAFFSSILQLVASIWQFILFK